jgi:hypothetical protein
MHACVMFGSVGRSREVSSVELGSAEVSVDDDSIAESRAREIRSHEYGPLHVAVIEDASPHLGTIKVCLCERCTCERSHKISCDRFQQKTSMTLDIF